MGDSPLKNWGGSNKDFDKTRSASINSDRFTEGEIKKYHWHLTLPAFTAGVGS
jgi:hypothetical protein